MHDNKKITSRNIVSNIKKELKGKKLYKRGFIELPRKNYPDDFREIKKSIEFSLITARDYLNPRELLPQNPVLRLIKKALSICAKPFIKTQTIFNANILNALENLYAYLKELEKHEKNRFRSTKIH